MNDDQQDWNFPFEEPLHEVFPQLHAAQNAWMAQLDSLHAPDRKTHELIRMVVTVGLRNPAGVQRHAQLARGRRDVGGDPRLDHADRAGPRAVARGRRDSRTRAGYEAAREAEAD